MRINTRFPVAVHILSLIAYYRDELLPSELMAGSVGTNPVVVRRILSVLKKKGLVDTQSGVKGAVLRKEPRDITLREIYEAVRSGNDTVFDIHSNPSPECDVGAHFADAINAPLQSAQHAMEKELASITLQDVVESIRRRNKRR